MLTTFVLVCFSWIFFRSPSLGHALVIIGRLNRGWGQPLHFHAGAPGYIGLAHPEFLLAVGLIVFLLFVQMGQHFGGIRERLRCMPVSIRWAAYVALTLFLINYGVVLRTPFIYYQF